MNAALLMFLSKYNTRNDSARDYTGTLPDGSPVTLQGFQTNDAPCHYLLRCAQCSGDKVTHILCITSLEDTLPIVPEGPNSQRYFQRTMERMIAEDPRLTELYAGDLPQIVTIPYDFGDDPDCRDVNLRSRRLYRRITDFFAGDGAPRRIYIDYTGGPRDTTFLMTELTRFLKYSGVDCGQIAYSNLQEKRLVSLNRAYNMFELLSGINDFVSYGKADSLRSIYLNRNNPVVDRLLLSLTRFSEAMSLCALDGIDEILARIQASVEEMEHYRLQPGDDMTISMLKDFLPQIRDKFPLDRQEKAVDLKLIRWCLDNGRLQQALILYTEKIPQLCFDTGLLKRSLIDSGYEAGNGKTEAVYGMYECLFRQIRELGSQGEFCKYLTRVQQFKQERKCSYPKALTGCLEEESWSPGCRGIAAAFIETMKTCYNFRDGSRTEAGRAIRFYGKDVPAKNIAAFIKNVLADEQMQHYFVYHNEQLWQESQNPASRDLLKKMEALSVLRGNPGMDVRAYSDALTQDQLYGLMAYYFAVKMLRNHTSHASGAVSPSIRYCWEQGLIPDMSMDYTTVMETLKKAEAFMSALPLGEG